MLWIKMRLLRGEAGTSAAVATDGVTPVHPASGAPGAPRQAMAVTLPRHGSASPRLEDESGGMARWR